MHIVTKSEAVAKITDRTMHGIANRSLLVSTFIRRLLQIASTSAVEQDFNSFVNVDDSLMRY